MEIDDLLSRLAVALGIGLLIGLERGWKSREAEPGSRAAGIRTFALCGLIGGMVAALASATGSGAGAALLLGIGFAVYAAVIAVFERDANRVAGSFSVTTTIAAMLTFALGAFAVMGDMRIAAAAAVATAGILAARENIHGWVERITWPELRSALVLLSMTFIVLPVVPDTDIGPSGGVNPREVWLIAIVLAGVSFLGYGAVKMFGPERGVLLAALAGGLVSSTAVAATSARRAAAGEGAPRLLAAGVSIATGVSFLRVVAIVAALKPELLKWVGPPLAAALAVAAAHALVSVYWDAGEKRGSKTMPANFKNPFSLWPVVGFALFLSAVIVVGRMVGETFGANGALIGAAGVGLADIDAITISMARLVPAPLTGFQAASAILAAVASNMLSKMALGVAVGGGRFAVEVSGMTAVCWLAGALAFWATFMFAPA